ncbi:hypothetical protein Salat_2527600 [Sesamum alatum]|uniref:Uncharacterized protein n=1 Tax=Sesamum alatum TaxID=300844 RepID=A0AAE2CCG6_9LAMI|nr:hypothetical protein Salat_2527600 [Sesamum alatum]
MFSRRNYVLGNVYVKNPRLMGLENLVISLSISPIGRFKVKALLETELLVVVGLHFVVDNYDGPESLYSHLRKDYDELGGILNFIPDNIPSNLLSSSGTRSASATPSDVPSSSRTRSQSKTPDAPSAIPMGSASPQPSSLYSTGPVHEPPVIEVVTSPEIEDFHFLLWLHLLPLLVTPTEVGLAFLKRPPPRTPYPSRGRSLSTCVLSSSGGVSTI